MSEIGFLKSQAISKNLLLIMIQHTYNTFYQKKKAV